MTVKGKTPNGLAWPPTGCLCCPAFTTECRVHLMQAAPDFSEATNLCNTLFSLLSALSGCPLNHSRGRSVWSERSTKHLLRNRRAGNQVVSAGLFGTAEFREGQPPNLANQRVGGRGQLLRHTPKPRQERSIGAPTLTLQEWGDQKCLQQGKLLSPPTDEDKFNLRIGIGRFKPQIHLFCVAGGIQYR